MDWVTTRILDRWTLQLPDLPHLGGWDVWEYWERERFDSLQEHLRKTDLLMEIGAEEGGLSACIAKIIGADRMILVEPETIVWPTIRAIFEHNDLGLPAWCLVALISDRTDVSPGDDVMQDGPCWPAVSHGDDLPATRAYRYIHEHADHTPQITVDDWVQRNDRYPTALNIDVEGAELRVLRGARSLLEKQRPLVWCSVHPDLLLRDYGGTPDALFGYMDDLGYVRQWLGTDHEEHHFFKHPKGR